MSEASNITSSPIDDGAPDAGVPHDTVLDTTDPEGNIVMEKVVYDMDEEGNVTGWHKEVVSNG